MLADLRLALRSLVKSPGFALVTILTLALGIGANSAVFSVVDRVLLRPLPYREPDRLVTMDHFYPSLKGLEAGVSVRGFEEYRDRARSFSGAAVEGRWQPNLVGRDDPERLLGARVAGQYFSVLGVPAALGRTLRPDEDRPGSEHVVVLGDALWRRRFGASRAVLGQTLVLDGEPHEVVGVMPPSFRDVANPEAEIWRPIAFTTGERTDSRTSEWLIFVARLRPGVTAERAQLEMRTLAEALKRENPDDYPPDWSLKLAGLREKGTSGVRASVLVLFGAVGFVLLIACANVANLMLARAASRSRELAVRTALGAQRGRIVRQLLTESVLLSVTGGLLGLLVASVGVRALVAFLPRGVGGADVGLDWPVVAFALGLSLVTGVLFGLLPALQTSRVDLQDALREGGRGAAGNRGAQAVRRGLIVAEVALALVLLAGAGLLTRSFANLQRVSPGFDPANVLTADVALPTAKYATGAQQRAFFEALLPRVAAIPGVTAVGAVTGLPMTGGGWTRSFGVEGYAPAPDAPAPWGDFRVISETYPRAMRIPLVKGRLFTEQDGPDAPRVTLVDEEMVRRYWPNADPIGRRLSFGRDTAGNPRWYEVVGVVAHVHQQSLDDEAHTQAYVPLRQFPLENMTLAVRTAGDPILMAPSLRAALQSVDRDQPLSRVATMDSLLSDSVGRRRSSAALLTVFAGFALLIACMGLYGVTAYSVTQRTREIGVRMALGAGSGHVVRTFVRDGLRLAAVGVTLGVAAALAGGRLLASQLFEVGAADPATLAATALTLGAVAALASYLPARRATRVNPITALQAE